MKIATQSIYYVGLERNKFPTVLRTGCMPTPSVTADPPYLLLPSQTRLSSRHLRTDLGIRNAYILVTKVHSLFTAPGQ